MKIRFTLTLTASTVEAYADVLGTSTPAAIVGDLTRTLRKRLDAVREGSDDEDNNDDDGNDDGDDE